MLFNSALHLDKQTLKFAVASVALNFLLNLFVIPRWGAIGAAWSTLITESLFSVCMVALLQSKLNAPAVSDLSSD
jgi:O-antigen/teichoic acid export membrane protein